MVVDPLHLRGDLFLDERKVGLVSQPSPPPAHETRAPLGVEIARDRQRAADFVRRRDAIRREKDSPERKSRSNGDVDPSGDLIEPSRYTVTGWRTRREDEEGQRLAADSPASAGRAVEELLRGGSYQVVIDDSRSPA